MWLFRREKKIEKAPKVAETEEEKSWSDEDGAGSSSAHAHRKPKPAKKAAGPPVRSPVIAAAPAPPLVPVARAGQSAGAGAGVGAGAGAGAVDEDEIPVFIADETHRSCPPGYAFAFHTHRVPPAAYACVEMPGGEEVMVYRLSASEQAREFPALRSGAPEFLAIDNTCTHKSARLGDGDIEEVSACGRGRRLDGRSRPGLCVLCPKHRRKFNNYQPGGGLYFSLVDGQSFTKVDCERHREAFRQDVFPVAVRKDRLYVRCSPLTLPETRARAEAWASGRPAPGEEPAAAAARAPAAGSTRPAAPTASLPAPNRASRTPASAPAVAAAPPAPAVEPPAGLEPGSRAELLQNNPVGDSAPDAADGDPTDTTVDELGDVVGGTEADVVGTETRARARSSSSSRSRQHVSLAYSDDEGEAGVRGAASDGPGARARTPAAAAAGAAAGVGAGALESVGASPEGRAALLRLAGRMAPDAATASAAAVEAVESDFEPWSVVSVERDGHSDDSFKWRLAGPPPPQSARAGLDAFLWHVTLCARVRGAVVERDYTPVSSLEEMERGIVDLVVKVYPRGRFTQWLREHAQPGSSVLLSGPHETPSAPALDAALPLRRALAPASVPPPPLLLLAGGTGIAPMLQAARRVAEAGPRRGAAAAPAVVLLRSDHGPRDVLMAPAVSATVERAGGAVHVLQTFSRPNLVPTGWSGLRGRITASSVEQAMRLLLSKSNGGEVGRALPIVIISGPEGFLSATEAATQTAAKAVLGEPLPADRVVALDA